MMCGLGFSPSVGCSILLSSARRLKVGPSQGLTWPSSCVTGKCGYFSGINWGPHLWDTHFYSQWPSFSLSLLRGLLILFFFFLNFATKNCIYFYFFPIYSYYKTLAIFSCVVLIHPWACIICHKSVTVFIFVVVFSGSSDSPAAFCFCCLTGIWKTRVLLGDFPDGPVGKNLPASAVAQVRSLVWEASTCHRATKPVHRNY